MDTTMRVRQHFLCVPLWRRPPTRHATRAIVNSRLSGDLRAPYLNEPLERVSAGGGCHPVAIEELWPKALLEACLEVGEEKYSSGGRVSRLLGGAVPADV